MFRKTLFGLLISIVFSSLGFAQIRKIQLKIEALDGSDQVVVSDNGIILSFTSNGTNGWDIYDASKLLPLSSTYINGALLGERNGGIAAKTIDSRPSFIADTLNIDLRFYTQNTNISGRWSIHEITNIPDEWSIQLLDLSNDSTVNLRNSSYKFSLPGSNGTYDDQFRLIVNPMRRDTLNITSSKWSLIGFPYESSASFFNEASWTQGFSGADIETGTPNMYLFSEPNGGFESLDSMSQVIPNTSGLAIYTFEDDEPGTPGVQGNATKNMISTLPFYAENYTVDLSFNSGEFEGWHLLSNPYWTDMQINQLDIAGNSAFTQFVYIWNQENNNYDLPAAGSTQSIPAFTGFWVRVNQTTDITFSATAPASKQNVDFEQLRLNVADVETGRTSEFIISIDETFSDELDPNDAPILNGLGNMSDLGFFVSKQNDKLKAISLKRRSENVSYSIPFEFTQAGTYEISISNHDSELQAYFNNPFSSFSLQESQFIGVDVPEEWVLHLKSRVLTSTEPDKLLPETIQVSAFPNPFNPTTQLQINVPNSDIFNLNVTDVMGRIVHSNQNIRYSEGEHTYFLDASQWASGTYYVSLNGTQSRAVTRITLLK